MFVRYASYFQEQSSIPHLFSLTGVLVVVVTLLIISVKTMTLLIHITRR
jgi:hypothetical protein